MSPVFVVYPASLLKPELLILPLVNFFCALEESTTTKKSPSPFEVEVVSSDKSTSIASAVTSIKLPAPTFRVTEPEAPPPVKPDPAVTPVMSPVLVV